MINNKTLLIVSIIAVIAVITLSIYFGRTKRNLSPVINAVPNKVALILETDDFSYLINKISKNKDIKSIISELKLAQKFNKNFSFIDSLIRNNKVLKKFINHKTVIVSAHLLGKENMDFLFATSFSERNKIINTFNLEILKIDKNIISEEKTFAGAEIFHKRIPNKKLDFFYTFYEDFFIMSFSEVLLQKSIKNINSKASLFSDNNFKILYQNTSNKSIASLFINYNNLFSFINSTTTNIFKDKNMLMQKFADWSVFNLNIKRKEINLTGHTILKPEMQFLRMFKNSKPERNKVLKILPEKTSMFIALNIGDGSDFKYKYEEYLGMMRNLNNHKIRLAEFYKKYRITEDKNSLYEIIGNEIALGYEDFNKNGKKHNAFVFLKYKDVEKAEMFFTSLNKFAGNNSEAKKYISNSQEYKIFKVPEKNLPEMFFGTIFKDVNARYVSFINDFMVFSEKINTLKTLINSYENERTLKRKSQNYSFIKSFSDQSNIFFYTDLFHSKSIVKQILKEEKAKRFEQDANVFEKIQGPAIQFISDTYPIYTSLKFTINSKKQLISETVWEVRLDTVIAGKPFIVLNHNTNEKEIVIQDVANKIYLINKSGKILWTRQLDGKIISEIYQIDFYKNKKLQLFFNTKNKIYCIDRKGNWLENYPVILKSTATNGLSVFDYSGSRDYRIFVATKNKKVYLYGKEGNIIDGWVFNKTKSTVTGKINHFVNKDKDYIVFRDKSNIYILNRRGETRVKPEANIQLSKNSDIFFVDENNNSKAHFSLTNPSGTVYSIFENGKIAKIELKQFTNNHFYKYVDVNGDKIPDYIFTDKNQTEAYNGKDKKRIYSYSYDENLINDLSVYKFSNTDTRLGTSSKNKIYLINRKGRLCKGFPLTGSGLFSIAVFDESNQYSLIVGNKDNYLYKYQIK